MKYIINFTRVVDPRNYWAMYIAVYVSEQIVKIPFEPVNVPMYVS